MKYPQAVAVIAAVALHLTTVAADAQSVANIGSQHIDRQDLDARSSAKLEAKRKEFEGQELQLKLSYEREQSAIQEQELQAILDDRVLALEATAKKTTAPALLKDVKVATVTEAQIQQFFEANKGQINQSYGNALPLIRDYLQKQGKATADRQYLDSLRSKYHAFSTLEPLRETVDSSGPRLGSSTAPITIVEFSDFQCPYCARFEAVLHEVLPKYPNSVALVYRNFPLHTLHPNAQLAAEAGVCARDQGKFWEMHDAMFAGQSALDAESLKQTAKRIGVDIQKFNDCLDTGKSRAAVEADTDAGNQLGLGGTPASFINGRFAHGALTAEELTSLIDDELRRRGATSAPHAI